MSLSACLMIKNEAESLPRCLESLQTLASEIIVLDTGSSDQSLQIASAFNAQILQRPWSGHFAQTRNQVLQAAQGDWILNIDADEWLEPESSQALQAFLKQAPPAIYALRWQQAPDQPPSRKAVLFPNHRGVVYLGRVHEIPWDPSGQLPYQTLNHIELAHAPRISPLSAQKVKAYRHLLAQDLEHPNPIERFHALRHWGQSELILQNDRAARAAFLAAWELFRHLPAPCYAWGSTVLEALLFLACETEQAEEYSFWRKVYAQAYPENPRLSSLPLEL
ncbi:hypothetical protein COW36_18200 [bacterium (Candidatus Blackallbacteria) CG17_big_fil_post_rev_8_21_14_2_50_48_46]|uniref:Glycosyltransferase 2-like domain-containing protein n=1 Tax=bacterium (Candidatus Blackallbacteria) CG17_big_fil_post_rev_8_21_14_2_50_48_46 TaxID=2014261 RepID=A0A2M7G0V6_9BACT|nr:MAG: hypothetical protein COW64_00535 [bacterium (Candidatus Blackallbacteria) CG18_big_fil_WC_8_21_14_2_50_49_26]PIW15348.1 MAG: hypothetical protein COW36_18200 [bacterium (Candidatus Blackallbacteria) CG17_big_fil_post_rev_8_21_14_2_50_48_46]PIW49791.1 MAG: hypothetical protein COW20_05165 [bacterium (Candidatus Blackallbacteria) CG13_big_fil_rev_8_21_14_2_50_49_14]